jgi:hypothetical protein
VVWSVIDRKRAAAYPKLDQWLRLSVRVVLAYAMFVYGGCKVIPSQMPPPSLSRLIQPFGEMTPYHLLWNFMGSSTGYEILCGLVEVSCGVLLLIPGMTMLGALLSLGALANVIIFNVFYDVAVKLIPLHLAVFAIFLLLPDTRRLLNLFVLNRGIEPQPRSPLFRRRWLNYLAWGIQWALGIYFIATTCLATSASVKRFHNAPLGNPLYGFWSVDEFIVDGQVRPPLLTDSLRWQRVLVDSEPGVPGKVTVAVEEMNGQWSPYIATMDTQKSTLLLGSPKPNEYSDWIPSSSVHINSLDRNSNAYLNYSRPQPDALILEGPVNGHRLRVTLRKEERRFVLKTHEFRWIHDSGFD